MSKLQSVWPDKDALQELSALKNQFKCRRASSDSFPGCNMEKGKQAVSLCIR